MWIRSQDGTELINTNRIQAESKCIYVFEGVAMDDCSYVQMGKYKTKERSIEVLDGIQQLIFNLENSKSYNIKSDTQDTLYSIYQMPKE